MDHLRGVTAATTVLVEALGSGEDLVASEVVRFELLAGVRQRELTGLEKFFASLIWIPVVEPVSRHAAQLALRHRPSHAAVDDADYLIAATAILLAADLLTTNVRHFPMVPNLRPAYLTCRRRIRPGEPRLGAVL